MTIPLQPPRTMKNAQSASVFLLSRKSGLTRVYGQKWSDPCCEAKVVRPRGEAGRGVLLALLKLHFFGAAQARLFKEFS